MVLSQANQSPYRFDFGPITSVTWNESVRVTAETKYTKERGYGLLTDSLQQFSKSTLQLTLGTEISDGLKKNGAISFRIDAPKGKYFVEIMMEGGTREIWEGSISVNGKVIVHRISSFGYSAESDYAPPYWAVIRPVENESGEITVSIAADKQPSSVAGIVLYAAEPGPIQFVDGVFKKSADAKAPNIDLALKLINAGKIRDAMRIVDAIPDQWRYERAHLLFAAASRIETESPHQFVEAAKALIEEEYRNNPSPRYRLDLRLAELYLRSDRHFKQAGWQWARDAHSLGIFGNCEVSAISSSEISSLPHHPLWFAATWHMAKTCYMLWVEQGAKGMIERADSLFRIIGNLYPRSDLVKMYLNEYEAPGSGMKRAAGVPEWAELQRIAVSQLKDVIHYWSEARQAEDGEFGGKYDDDVEMMRWWPFARVGVDDSITLAGMKRLVDGMWNSSWIENGWSKKVRDVEHSSEPVADTQPMMIGFDYGNPVYVERCMQSLKLAMELWTGKNAYGHRHFKSTWYSSTEVDTEKPKDCDVSYNTRTVKAIRWLAWYNRHPEALKFLKEWGDAWLEDCMRTDKGKPKGIVPAAIRFSDDAIGGHADNWHHPGMYWNYYDYHGATDMLMEFMTNYQLFHDPKYLQPIEMSLELVKKHQGLREVPKETGSEEWAAYMMMRSGGFWDVAELWRLATSNTKYDDLLRQKGSAYIKFRLTSDDQYLRDELTAMLKDARENLPLITTEGYFTDRIEIRNLRDREDRGAGVLESMYLGAPTVDLFFPFSPIFWSGFDTTFSALVLNASPTGLTAKMFNHAATVQQGRISFLQLSPGRYILTKGIDADHDGTFETVTHTETLDIAQRNFSLPVSSAPGKEELLVVKQLAGAAQPETAMCDLAVTASELRVVKKSVSEVEVTLPVHNIGTLGAANVLVELMSHGAALKVLSRTTVAKIDAPLDMVPKSQRVSFTLPALQGRYTIRVSLPSGGQEITDVNNSVSFSL
ncbi:MAG: hypothetical protein NTU47_13825 [Ignavibacteriales bacterium]|nr:hypothetical protein [Ignavibacteriales bacterium]